MTMRSFRGLAMLLVAGAASTSYAQQGGAYLKAFGGGNWQEAIESNGAVNLYQEFDSGGLVGGGVGYDFGQSRVEFEYTYRGDNNIEALRLNGNNIATISGDIQSDAYLFNFQREIDLGRAITPYVGAGIGYANVNQNVAYQGARSVSVTENADAFAYQLMVGARTQVTQRAEMFLEYRYFGTAEFDIQRDVAAVPDDPLTVPDESLPAVTQLLQSEYDTHGLVFGITFKR